MPVSDAGAVDSGVVDAGRGDSGVDAGVIDAGPMCSPAQCGLGRTCRENHCVTASLSYVDAGTPRRHPVGPCASATGLTARSYRGFWQDDFRTSAGLPDDYFRVGEALPQINNEQQHYGPTQVRVDAEGLHLTARRVAPFVAADGKTYRYRSGEVHTANKANAFGRATGAYGRWEVCARLPTAQGSWPAIWLLRDAPGAVPGNTPWPPEIDVMEHVGNLNDVQTNVFWGVQPNQQMAEMRHTGVPAGGVTGFHLYAVEYDATTIDFFVDDVLIRSYTVAANIPSVPMYLILNLAVGGVLPSYRPPCDAPMGGVNMTCGDGVAAYDSGVEMVVRYVRRYE